MVLLRILEKDVLVQLIFSVEALQMTIFVFLAVTDCCLNPDSDRYSTRFITCIVYSERNIRCESEEI